MRASNEAAKPESAEGTNRGQEQRGGRSIMRGSSCPILPGPTGSLGEAAHRSRHRLTVGGGRAPSPRRSLTQMRAQSQSAHSHFESDKPFPRFTLKNKYTRPARTGVRAKQRRGGPCQLSGLIYSLSRGTGWSLARQKTQRRGIQDERKAISGGKRPLWAGVGTRATHGMLTASWVVGLASPHFADGETETQRSEGTQLSRQAQPRSPETLRGDAIQPAIRYKKKSTFQPQIEEETRREHRAGMSAVEKAYRLAEQMYTCYVGTRHFRFAGKSSDRNQVSARMPGSRPGKTDGQEEAKDREVATQETPQKSSSTRVKGFLPSWSLGDCREQELRPWQRS